MPSTEVVSPHLIPLTVAVTGHRDIDPIHEELIHEKLVGKLKEFRDQYPDTPVRCLSGLAEGADMVFARAALSLGLELVAVIPDSTEEFIKDFREPAHPGRSAEALASEFKDILGRCSDVVHVHVPEAMKHTAMRYAHVGIYLARHSHILLAVWDGKESSKIGGTRHVMKLFQEGINEEHLDDIACKLNPPERRQVHALYVPRNGMLPKNIFGWADCSGLASEESGPMLKALNRFNYEAARLRVAKPNLLALSASYLDFSKERIELNKGEQSILGAFVAADALAGEYQLKTLLYIRSIFIAAILMVISFATYSNNIITSPLALGAYIAFFTAGLIVYWHNRKNNCYTQYLDYRGLAEGLRVLLFYRLAAAPVKASDQYLRKQHSEITWIRDAIRTIDLTQHRSKPEIDIVSRRWIADQQGYFERAARRDIKIKNKNNMIALVLFICGLTLALVWLVIQPATYMGEEAAKWFITFIGLLPAIAATLAGYTYRLGVDQQTKQYSRMHDVFSRAAKLVSSIPDKPEETRPPRLSERERKFISIVMELGREALAENADWIILHRDRPMTWPQ
ncbi:hypothetical protein [Fundidesulfovibrio agrisoli]|uniref:hypothetical protein n=1 Tax=Fundidesulfovibrio agrisoli TaxID=2922717 RepID=UPI001FAC7264|nr:hypothetical protein [Fundidesulfovibrio agrisoli]